MTGQRLPVCSTTRAATRPKKGGEGQLEPRVEVSAAEGLAGGDTEMTAEPTMAVRRERWRRVAATIPRYQISLGEGGCGGQPDEAGDEGAVDSDAVVAATRTGPRASGANQISGRALPAAGRRKPKRERPIRLRSMRIRPTRAAAVTAAAVAR